MTYTIVNVVLGVLNVKFIIQNVLQNGLLKIFSTSVIMYLKKHYVLILLRISVHYILIMC